MKSESIILTFGNSSELKKYMKNNNIKKMTSKLDYEYQDSHDSKKDFDAVSTFCISYDMKEDILYGKEIGTTNEDTGEVIYTVGEVQFYESDICKMYDWEDVK